MQEREKLASPWNTMGVPRELVGLFHPAFSKCYSTTSPTVLFIDHHSCSWRTLVRKPWAAGYDVCVAVDGEEAIRLFRLYPIDAVVPDCGLFPPSNVDAVRLCRSLSPDVPVIMTSSYCRAAPDRMPAANVSSRRATAKRSGCEH
jgi:CheY-like chemotaxis protein